MLFQYVLYFRNSSLKKKREPDVFKVHSKKKLDGYIHHVVSNSLPPTAQVGGAVINSTKLPLPPIQIPNTAPPMIITAPSKKSIPKMHKDPVTVDTEESEVGSGLQGNASKEPTDTENNGVDDTLQGHTEPGDTELDTLQSDSNPSVGSNEVSEVDSHNNNDADITAGTTVSLNTENLESPLPPIKTTETTSISMPKVDSHRRKVKPLKSPVTTKSPKHSLKHKKKLLPSALSSSPLLDSADHSCDGLTAASKDDKVLPTLRGKNVKPSSQFDVVTSLTGKKR